MFCVLLNEKNQHWPQSSIMVGGYDDANVFFFQVMKLSVHLPSFFFWLGLTRCGAAPPLRVMIHAFDCRRSHRSDERSPDCFSCMFLTVAAADFISTFWFISEFHLPSLTINIWINNDPFSLFMHNTGNK